MRKILLTGIAGGLLAALLIGGVKARDDGRCTQSPLWFGTAKVLKRPPTEAALLLGGLWRLKP
jgi:hypothetical protein